MPRGHVDQARRARRPDRRHRRPDRPRRHPRRDLQLGRAHRRERDGLRRRRADRQRDHREDGARRRPPGPRPRPLPLDHRLRRGRLQLGRRRDGRPSSAPRSTSTSAPLKYEGLSYTEIWISEAQERMVLAVPPEQWPELKALCDSEQVEATDLGEFVARPGRLTLRYHGERRRRPLDGLPPRRPAPRSSARRPGRPRQRRPLAAGRGRLHGRPARDPRALGRLQQGMDRPPVRPRGPGRGR